MKILPVAGLLMTVLAPWSAAYGATATTSMVNIVTVAGICQISSTGFSTTYDPTGTNLAANQDTTASVSTTCTSGAAATITLGQGLHPDTGSTDALPLRRLSNGAGTPGFLSYSLSSDSNRVVPWGNVGAAGIAVVGTGVTVPVTVYARVPAAQTSAVAGTYTDTVIATITY